MEATRAETKPRSDLGGAAKEGKGDSGLLALQRLDAPQGTMRSWGECHPGVPSRSQVKPQERAGR